MVEFATSSMSPHLRPDDLSQLRLHDGKELVAGGRIAMTPVVQPVRNLLR